MLVRNECNPIHNDFHEQLYFYRYSKDHMNYRWNLLVHQLIRPDGTPLNCLQYVLSHFNVDEYPWLTKVTSALTDNAESHVVSLNQLNLNEFTVTLHQLIVQWIDKTFPTITSFRINQNDYIIGSSVSSFKFLQDMYEQDAISMEEMIQFPLNVDMYQLEIENINVTSTKCIYNVLCYPLTSVVKLLERLTSQQQQQTLICECAAFEPDDPHHIGPQICFGKTWI